MGWIMVDAGVAVQAESRAPAVTSRIQRILPEFYPDVREKLGRSLPGGQRVPGPIPSTWPGTPGQNARSPGPESRD